MSTLMTDLERRGLLDSTLVVWMGEFGRTPTINPQAGRDHYPKAWSTVLGGGGIRGGQVIGQTSADGMSVVDRKVSVPDFLATICEGIGLDPRKQNMSNVARPIRLVDPEGKALREALL
jgi:arylsulfatase A-like enzyme